MTVLSSADIAENVHHPHDSAFKNALADKRVAQEFFELYLPDTVKNHLDLST